MPADATAILEGALCPDSLFNDEYDAFVEERAERLASVASQLIA